MTQVTADLEYFRCDVCGKFLHRDIFCDHRRECRGEHSQELTKKQAESVSAELDNTFGLLRKGDGGPPIALSKLEQLQRAKRQQAVSNTVAQADKRKIQDQLAKYDAAKLLSELQDL